MIRPKGSGPRRNQDQQKFVTMENFSDGSGNPNDEEPPVPANSGGSAVTSVRAPVVGSKAPSQIRVGSNRMNVGSAASVRSHHLVVNPQKIFSEHPVCSMADFFTSRVVCPKNAHGAAGGRDFW